MPQIFGLKKKEEGFIKFSQQHLSLSSLPCGPESKWVLCLIPTVL